MLRLALQTACAAAGLTAKWNAFVYLQYLPFGARFLPTIYTATAVYLSAWLLLRRMQRTARRSTPLTAAAAALLGVPLPDRPVASALGVVATLLAAVFSADFTYRAHWIHPSHNLAFSRTGWVTADSARISLRSPVEPAFNLTYAANGADVSTIEVTVRAGDDFAGVASLHGLAPDTAYTYTTTAGHAGSFITRRGDGDLAVFSLVSTSCQKPNWPYNPLSDARTINGLARLDAVVARMARQPEMMLFLGDFIYSDLPLPLAEYTTDYYRTLYRQIYASPSWTTRLRALPWVHMFDDHEIVNDYGGPGAEDLFARALVPVRHYQLAANPPAVDRMQPTYTQFNIGDVAFFVLDNRSFRAAAPPRPGANSTAGQGGRTMLGAQQLAALRAWAHDEGPRRLLVLVSGVPMTRNWSEGGDEFDSWAGYLDEREEVLELLWAAGGAVIISGDRHEHATTLLPPPAESVHPYEASVIEFSTSPLSFFYQPWKREYVAHPPSDMSIYLHWEGVSKLGVFQFDTSGETPAVHFRLVVDGKDAWEYIWRKGVAVAVP